MTQMSRSFTTRAVRTFGAQWWKNNAMSGLVSSGVASFKGYANRADDFCGGTWQSRPGNSSNPPDIIPDRIAIIVTDTVLKEGPNISGTIKDPARRSGSGIWTEPRPSR